VDGSAPSTAPVGTVIGQSPGGGAVLPLGSLIHLTLSNGEPPKTVVPNVVGMTREAALSTLHGKGFTATSVFTPVHDKKLDGIVVRQSPAPGQKVDDGSNVTITVGHYEPGPSPKPTPSQTIVPKPKPTHSPKPKRTKGPNG
jgi:serine/threonine-protein kinase